MTGAWVLTRFPFQCTRAALSIELKRDVLVAIHTVYFRSTVPIIKSEVWLIPLMHTVRPPYSIVPTITFSVVTSSGPAPSVNIKAVPNLLDKIKISGENGEDRVLWLDMVANHINFILSSNGGITTITSGEVTAKDVKVALRSFKMEDCNATFDNFFPTCAGIRIRKLFKEVSFHKDTYPSTGSRAVTPPGR